MGWRYLYVVALISWWRVVRLDGLVAMFSNLWGWRTDTCPTLRQPSALSRRPLLSRGPLPGSALYPARLSRYAINGLQLYLYYVLKFTLIRDFASAIAQIQPHFICTRMQQCNKINCKNLLSLKRHTFDTHQTMRKVTIKNTMILRKIIVNMLKINTFKGQQSLIIL